MKKLVAIYVRLSVNENGERDESLETQADLLITYVNNNKLGEYKLYVDDDLSGVYFDRPSLLHLKDDIADSKINVVIIKDLSRLGRNNGETLRFLDFLLENNVRIIALNDNYDSIRDDDETIGIKTWVNEYYCRDISKKVRSNLKKKMERGEFLGRPPFGYQKSEKYKNKLIVDERYRYVIEKIFELYLQGWGYRTIADYIQSLNVPNPSLDKGYRFTSKAVRWNEQHIRRIITNRVYCGDSVQGVSEKVSFKSRKVRRLPSERWVVVSGTHEGIISRETFELAQKIRNKRWLEGHGRKKNRKNNPHLFSGFIVCATCGTHHVYRKRKDRPPGYICGLYNRFGRKECSSHYVSEEKLLHYMISDIQTMAYGISFHKPLIDEYKKNIVSGDLAQKKIIRLEKELINKQQQLKTVYRDKVKGLISEGLFNEINVEIEGEIAILAEQKKRLIDSLEEAKNIEIYIDEINSIKFEINSGDIDRKFIEKYINRILVIHNGEINNSLIKEYDIIDFISYEEINQFLQKKVKLIILYNLLPMNTH